MTTILYATGNFQRFHSAQHVCKQFDLHLTQHGLDVPEIQSEDGIEIARDKAFKAYEKFRMPLLISDDNWSIPGLNGFPGAYMKSMNEWLTVQDWLNLTKPLEDRRIILQQITVFQDGPDETNQKVFSFNLEGILLSEAVGISKYSHSSITSFDDGKHSNAEFHERDESAAAHRRNVWHDFAEWYTSEYVTDGTNKS